MPGTNPGMALCDGDLAQPCRAVALEQLLPLSRRDVVELTCRPSVDGLLSALVSRIDRLNLLR